MSRASRTARFTVRVKDLFGRTLASWTDVTREESQRLVDTWPLQPGERIVSEQVRP